MAALSYDEQRRREAKTRRKQQIEVLRACTCTWPLDAVRNMVGHPDSCPAYDVWQRQHNPKPEGTR
jgi:hypothetical protein